MGQDGIEIDIFVKSLQFESLVEEQLKKLPSPYKEYIEAYVAGINEYAKRATLPLEFRILGMDFEEWTVKDTLLVTKAFAFMCSGHWQLTPLRHHLEQRFGAELAERVLPIGAEYAFLEPVSIIPGDGKLPKLGERYKTTAKTTHIPSNQTNSTHARGKPGMRGSNAWVIHGNYTKSGKPILANDPHLPHIIPSTIYLATLKFPSGHTFVGMGSTGIPSPIVGRTENIAWGITLSLIEAIDIYSIKVNDKRTHYWYNGTWTPLKITEEKIKVKDSEDVKFKVYKTHHGPLINVTVDAASFFA